MSGALTLTEGAESRVLDEAEVAVELAKSGSMCERERFRSQTQPTVNGEG